jgi:phosphate-selective porin OprO/OprP
MKRKSPALAALLGCILTSLPPIGVAAEEARVVDEILEILREGKQIDEEKYEELKRRADEERKDSEGAKSAERKAPPEDFRVYFKDGIHFDTADEAFELKLGGRIQLDAALIDPDRDVSNAFEGLDAFESGVEFRRARIYLSGTIYDHVEFKAEYDFAGGSTSFADVWMGLKGIPWVELIKVGHFKEPFGLEQLTSSNWDTFMERGLPSAFDPARNTGVGVYLLSDDQRVTFSTGGFRETSSSGNGFGSDSPYDVTSRLTGLPWYENSGRRLLHIGLSYSHQFRDDDPLQVEQRPEAHLSPVQYVDTGDFDADDVNLINPELALVVGPFSVQGEYKHSFVQLPDGSNPQFQGFYAYASYFLTGESRPYKPAEAVFDRVKPAHNFLSDGGGWGAWEVAARYSYLDLNDESIDGGRLGDVTAGVNWYLNPDVRVTVNYVFADLHDVGNTNIVETRFQLAF